MKKVYLTSLLISVFTSSAHSWWPVYDYLSWLQKGKMIITQANQYRNQLLQFKNQISQYQNMLKNTKSLTSFQWDSANHVIDNLMSATNTIDSYKQEAGNLNGYLERYRSSEYYEKTACFIGGCSKAELAKIEQNKLQASVAQKRANDALIKGLDQQQQNIKSDSDTLRILQSKAENAEGQKQALQAASQLASNQTNQLLQIRSLMISQQNSQSTKDSSDANKQALQDAASKRFRSGEYHKSTGIKW